MMSQIGVHWVTTFVYRSLVRPDFGVVIVNMLCRELSFFLLLVLFLILVSIVGASTTSNRRHSTSSSTNKGGPSSDLL